MRVAGDEEVNGAAAALLGLHSSTSLRPPQPHSATATPVPVPVPKRTCNPWNSGTFLLPSAPPAPLAGTERTPVQRTIFPGHACTFPYYPGHGIPQPYFEVPARAVHLGYREPGGRENFAGGPGGWVPPQLTPDPRALVTFPGPLREEPWAHQNPATAVLPKPIPQPLQVSSTEQQLPQPPHRTQSDISPSTLSKPEPSKTTHVETCAQAAVEGASSNHKESPDPAVKREDHRAQLQQQKEKEEEKEEEPEEKSQLPQEKQSGGEERSKLQAPQQEKQQDQEQERKEEAEQRNEEKEKPSINKLWSLIPGSVQRRSSQASSVSEVALGESLPALGNERSYDLSFATALNKSSHLLTIDAASRWFPPDVHPPLSDRARRHRARALARLRARRRALAAAGASSDRKLSTLRRRPSDTSTDAESIDSGGDYIQSGLLMAGTMGCKQDVHGTSASWDGTHSAAGFNQSFSYFSGSKKIDPSMAKDEGGDADGDQTATTMSSKVGDLFELMRNVSANAAATALAAEGGGRSDGETEGRELGRPVKYKYRQEAARSRKRTRGRFVSEKAPAFVSITELLALRRAERERQQQKDVAPVSVGAGNGVWWGRCYEGDGVGDMMIDRVLWEEVDAGTSWDTLSEAKALEVTLWAVQPSSTSFPYGADDE